jgi:hypothetical protein
MRINHFPFYLLLIIGVLISCEHPDIPKNPNSGNLDNANLVVNVATVEHIPFPAFTTRASVSDAFSRISIAVFDSNGQRADVSNKSRDDDGYGSASFFLPSGTYQVVVIGHSAKQNPTTTDASKIQFTKATGYSDTFLHSEIVEVGDTPVVVNADVQRIVSLCRVVIADTIPENVSKLHFEYTGGSGYFDASTGYGISTSGNKQQVDFDAVAGRDSTVYDLYTFLPDDAGSIHLKAQAKDAEDNTVCAREIDVPLRRRQISKFTGSFFAGASGSTITIVISVDDEWEGETIINF